MESNKNEPQRIGSNVECNVSFLDRIEKRSFGLRQYQLSLDDSIAFKLYSNFHNFDLGHKINTEKNLGGIFNLEFSLDGKLLVAACEGKQVITIDAASQKLINTIPDAHQNCVNCVRFLNDKHFATCSDDTSIKIWDIRKLKYCMKTLHGHSNWVKNIEWSEKDNVMVTSAFDGSIYAWNLKSPNESNMMYDKVFLMNGLMRMKLTEDGTKMVISTTNGFMIIIHDLNLLTLATDLRSFRPSLYRLMQMSDQCFPVGTVYNYLFSPLRKRNRIEFVDDFPNEAEVISSLQIHPHGWCAVSRNLNDEENEEWTTVHDIQSRDPKDYENAFTYVSEELPEGSEQDNETNNRPTDLWMGYISLEEYSNHNRDFSQVTQNIFENFQVPTMGILNTGLIGVNSSFNTYFRQHPEHSNKIVRNLPRMTHYIKEKNVGKGFIKELCFSSDGRVICSPFDRGIRMLAFDDNCSELSCCVPDNPQQLKTVIEMNDYHKDVVVSCKFSPLHHQLVSGCLNSEIKWYQPVI
ncbi:DDB1- and CUL4-associated factor 10 homolog [Diorhabda sublineata]|uniref:DDB1- and CUL4-associated factor 10 homolog n=1 Tax=Diorhabda sublineata TaxID=1163346 RepID=UPI0024E0FE6C|nr:DDB1- and CUL4-associated factor 10 homolog [Diorhabda sublineata]